MSICVLRFEYEFVCIEQFFLKQNRSWQQAQKRVMGGWVESEKHVKNEWVLGITMKSKPNRVHKRRHIQTKHTALYSRVCCTNIYKTLRHYDKKWGKRSTEQQVIANTYAHANDFPCKQFSDEMCRKNKHLKIHFFQQMKKWHWINRKQNKAKEAGKMQNKTLSQTQLVFSFQLILSFIEINYPSIAFFICLLASEPNRSEIQKQNKKTVWNENHARVTWNPRNMFIVRKYVCMFC